MNPKMMAAELLMGRPRDSRHAPEKQAATLVEERPSEIVEWRGPSTFRHHPKDTVVGPANIKTVIRLDAMYQTSYRKNKGKDLR